MGSKVDNLTTTARLRSQYASTRQSYSSYSPDNLLHSTPCHGRCRKPSPAMYDLKQSKYYNQHGFMMTHTTYKIITHKT